MHIVKCVGEKEEAAIGEKGSLLALKLVNTRAHRKFYSLSMVLPARLRHFVDKQCIYFLRVYATDISSGHFCEFYAFIAIAEMTA